MATELEKAAMFSTRAAELRGIAKNVKDPTTKDAMIKWAQSYEVIAKRIIAEWHGDRPELPGQNSN